MGDHDIPGLTAIEAEAPEPPSDSTAPRPRRMLLNMGPQHPSTHGVLRLQLELDGENIVSAQPDIGYLHTGIEKVSAIFHFHAYRTLISDLGEHGKEAAPVDIAQSRQFGSVEIIGVGHDADLIQAVLVEPC